METIAEIIERNLNRIVGLQLSIARRAGSLRNFQFGAVRAIEGGTVGQYALHIQCSWRIQNPRGIFTGQSDLWAAADPDQEIDWETWHYDKNKNLQDGRIGQLLQGYDARTDSFFNETDMLVVEAVSGDLLGGARIKLSGGYELVIFPDGTASEDWRLFEPNTDAPHFVIWGGKVETTESEAI